MIEIRNYERQDAPVTWDLKFQTIRNINIRDYSAEHVAAWAPANIDADAWLKRVNEMKPFIAEINGQVVGFADLQKDGYIDHFFCHADYQGIGVGRALMAHIFAVGSEKGVSHYYSAVSITARPFFERFGFRVVKEQQMEVNGLLLSNFLMEKLVSQ
ncbi:GNAT family N-acetyltransferase [Aliagarivorans marinus]|uniref:GNAT family N-acetyltransferase n=1 Tax=Aliagarivorans marinus TaxID=561965 RepID=UPI00047917B5|nr:GNAT family N-acetyltransferase [Aliagarivorans marinus]